jgi:hypothetical protein
MSSEFPWITKTPWATGKRQCLVLLLGALPALCLGFFFGQLASSIGSPGHLGSILLRGLIFAAPSSALVLLAPRYWMLPSLVYGFGFSGGYTFSDSMASSFSVLLGMPYAALTGQPVGTPPLPSHSELPWLILIALWITCGAYLLRPYGSRPKNPAS